VNKIDKVYYDQFSYICNPPQVIEYLKFKFSDLKEVKKVKKEVDFSKIPYFETKVVKVKKEKKCQHSKVICCANKTFPRTYKCIKCGKFFLPPFQKNYLVIKEEKENKGNFVNGENLDKIKFPCLCKWNDNIGMIIYDFWDVPMFTLIKIDKQTNRNHTYSHSESLEKLIRDFDIHILKGKFIIFEEVK
jgi:hypothetical protein